MTNLNEIEIEKSYKKINELKIMAKLNPFVEENGVMEMDEFFKDFENLNDLDKTLIRREADQICFSVDY